MPNYLTYYRRTRNPGYITGLTTMESVLPTTNLKFRLDNYQQLYQDSGFTTAATADGDPVGGWKDLSTNALHMTQGTSGNRPLLKIVSSKNEILFDGSNDSMRASGGFPVLASNFTIASWYKWEATGQTNKYLLTARTLAADLYAIIYGFTSQKFEFYSEAYTGTNPRTALTTSINDTVWHHIAWTYNGTTLIGYLDGVSDKTSTITFVLSSGAATLRLGESNTANYPNVRMATVLIYDRALTATEIAQVYSYGR